MARLTVGRIAWRALLVAALIAGLLMTGILIDSYVALLPTFLLPRNADFWADVVAYHARSPGHKSLDELYDAYGMDFVRDYVVVKSTYPGLMPSEKASLAYWLNEFIEEDEGRPHFDLGGVRQVLAVFLMFYFPAVVFINLVSRSFTWAFCRGERPAHLYAEHFHAPWHRRLLGASLALVFVVLLAFWNAAVTLTPELESLGFNLMSLTLMFVLLSYLSGLGLRVVRAVVDGAFIAWGVDPEKTWWDEVVTVAVTAPLLLALFRNSWIAVASDLVAGLGPLLIVKVMSRLFGSGRPSEKRAATESGHASDVLAADLWLGVAVTSVGAFCFLCCGSTSAFAAILDRPVRMTVAELEAKGAPDDRKTLDLSDGYLFWPKLTPAYGTGSRVKFYYAPLVSREVLDGWLAEYRDKGAAACYSFSRCVVVVRFYPGEFARLFPGVAEGRFDRERPFEPYAVLGESGPLSRLSNDPIDALEAGTTDFDARQMFRVANNRPSEIPRVLFITACVSVVILLPLGIRWLRGGLTWWGRPPTVLPVDDGPLPPTVLAVDDERPAAGTFYYYHVRGKTLGPVTLIQLRELARSGRLRRDDRVCRAGERQWVRADRVTGLFSPRDS